jgi:hypothetical protein
MRARPPLAPVPARKGTHAKHKHESECAGFARALLRAKAPYLNPSEGEAFARSGYLPPTTLKRGLATTILAGSDHDICCAPVGRV